jgi:hypothetical protein
VVQYVFYIAPYETDVKHVICPQKTQITQRCDVFVIPIQVMSWYSLTPQPSPRGEG